MSKEEGQASKAIVSFFKISMTISLLLLISCEDNRTPLDKFYANMEQTIQPDTLGKFANRIENDRNHLDYYEIFRISILDELAKNEGLERMFVTNGIENENDRIYILFAALHRKINNKSTNLDSLMVESKIRRVESNKRQKEYAECEYKRRRIAQDNYNRINKGDEIIISYPYKIGPNNHKNAILYSCPTSFKEEDDYVFITGRVRNKMERNYDDSLKLLRLEIVIVNNSNEDIPVLMEIKRKGDIHTVELESYGREIQVIKNDVTEQLL